MFERILVVCTGNICRSPAAEAFLKQRLPERHISSAGLGAFGCDQPPGTAINGDNDTGSRSHSGDV